MLLLRSTLSPIPNIVASIVKFSAFQMNSRMAYNSEYFQESLDRMEHSIATAAREYAEGPQRWNTFHDIGFVDTGDEATRYQRESLLIDKLRSHSCSIIGTELATSRSFQTRSSRLRASSLQNETLMQFLGEHTSSFSALQRVMDAFWTSAPYPGIET